MSILHCEPSQVYGPTSYVNRDYLSLGCESGAPDGCVHVLRNAAPPHAARRFVVPARVLGFWRSGSRKVDVRLPGKGNSPMARGRST